jgi:hypothetical protein
MDLDARRDILEQPGTANLLGRALGRVVAHEAFHIITPGHPHAAQGLMCANLTRRDLTRSRLFMDPVSATVMVAHLDDEKERQRMAAGQIRGHGSHGPDAPVGRELLLRRGKLDLFERLPDEGYPTPCCETFVKRRYFCPSSSRPERAERTSTSVRSISSLRLLLELLKDAVGVSRLTEELFTEGDWKVQDASGISAAMRFLMSLTGWSSLPASPDRVDSEQASEGPLIDVQSLPSTKADSS